MVYSQWLWQLPQTALYLDILITGYYFILICNLEQFENKLLTCLVTQDKYPLFNSGHGHETWTPPPFSGTYNYTVTNKVLTHIEVILG